MPWLAQSGTSTITGTVTDQSGAGGFGIVSSASDPRIIQFGLKLSF